MVIETIYHSHCKQKKSIRRKSTKCEGSKTPNSSKIGILDALNVDIVLFNTMPEAALVNAQ